MAELTELQQAYLTMQAASGFEVGDTVKVLRKAHDHEMGWQTCWFDDMDEIIGRTVVIESIYPVGFVISGSSGCFFVPFFVLELVAKAPTAKPLTAGEYEVGFSDDGDSIKVGCQNVTFDEVKAIYKHMKKLQKLTSTTRYDWSKAPDWARWIATDANGEVFAYLEKPSISPISFLAWRSTSSRVDFVGLSEANCPDWRESLEERPQ